MFELIAVVATLVGNDAYTIDHGLTLMGCYDRMVETSNQELVEVAPGYTVKQWQLTYYCKVE